MSDRSATGCSQNRCRMPALQQVVVQRNMARSRLRRSLWVSALFHAAILFVLVPLSLPALSKDPPTSPRAMQVQRLELIPTPQQPPPPPERARLPEPEIPEEPDPSEDPERWLEFLRAHQSPSASSALATNRISTQHQLVEQERHARARSQVADGEDDRGERSGQPRSSVQAGALPQQAAPAAREQPAEGAPVAQAAANPERPEPNLRETTAGEQDALAMATELQQSSEEAAHRREQAASHSQAARHKEHSTDDGRPGEWSPIATRVDGAQQRVPPYPEAPNPDAPGLSAQRAAVPQASQREAPSESGSAGAEQADEQSAQAQLAPAAQREPSETTQTSAARSAQSSTPGSASHELELNFLVEPLVLAREAREQHSQSAADSASQRQRDSPPGSARSAAAQAPGNAAAAGGSVVSALDPPITIDLLAALSVKEHPLARALQALDDELRDRWIIPLDLRASGIVGTTGLEFLIDRRGHIHGVEVVRPSGHEQLDQLAAVAIPGRLRGFRALLPRADRYEFPHQGLRIRYQFAYTDSPVAGVL